MQILRTTIVAFLGAPFMGVNVQPCSAFTASNSHKNTSFMQNSKTGLTVTKLGAFRSGLKTDEIELASEGKYDTLLDPVADVCILGLRLGTCALMVHHGLDKIQNVDGFSANVVAKFFWIPPRRSVLLDSERRRNSGGRIRSPSGWHTRASCRSFHDGNNARGSSISLA
mmetsp:Transcript_27882/g.63844  ORF Transcript_27882/g.63844 Transcript_27882/m.63844 type:complete len:169 (-) Transcript_27882:252-758(-)